MLRGDLGREMPPAMWCESFLFCLPIKALIKSKPPPHTHHGVASFLLLFLLSSPSVLALPLLTRSLFFQWVAMEYLPTDGSRWNQRLGYPSHLTQRRSVPSPCLQSLVHAVPDAWHTLSLVFLPGKNQPTHLSSVLTSVKISVTPPLFLLLGRSTINHHLWIPIELLRSVYGSAYRILFEDGAWVPICLRYLSPAPALTQSPARVGTQWLAWNKWMNKEMGSRVTRLDKEKMRLKKWVWAEREELNDSLPLSTPQRGLIYIIKIQITRRMICEPTSRYNCRDGKEAQSQRHDEEWGLEICLY